MILSKLARVLKINVELEFAKLKKLSDMYIFNLQKWSFFIEERNIDNLNQF